MTNASSHVSMNMNYVTEKKLMPLAQNSTLDLYNLCYILLLICNKNPLKVILARGKDLI